MNVDDLPATIAAKISLDCWSWTGAANSKGYPCIGVGGVSQLAHRVVYELTHGPIPDGLTVDHLCRNKRCIRPDHLEAVPALVNNDRKDYSECRKGHPMSPENTREHRRRNGRTTYECRECAIEAVARHRRAARAAATA